MDEFSNGKRRHSENLQKVVGDSFASRDEKTFDTQEFNEIADFILQHFRFPNSKQANFREILKNVWLVCDI